MSATGDGTSRVGAEIGRFVRSFKSVQAQMSHRARHGVDPSAYAVLFQLVESPQRTTELAGSLYADPSTISRQVTALVELGYVERTADPEDRRATILVATEQGRATYAAMRQARERMLGLVMSTWSAAEVRDLERALTRFNDDFEVARPAIIANLSADFEEH